MQNAFSLVRFRQPNIYQHTHLNYDFMSSVFSVIDRPRSLPHVHELVCWFTFRTMHVCSIASLTALEKFIVHQFNFHASHSLSHTCHHLSFIMTSSCVWFIIPRTSSSLILCCASLQKHTAGFVSSSDLPPQTRSFRELIVAHKRMDKYSR